MIAGGINPLKNKNCADIYIFMVLIWGGYKYFINKFTKLLLKFRVKIKILRLIYFEKVLRFLVSPLTWI